MATQLALSTIDNESTSPRNIMTIPLETFEHIAQLVDENDLLNLRLVCREASHRVMRTYTQAHFMERAFLLNNEDSLRTPLDIVKHKHFSRSMKKIILCIDVLSRDGEDSSSQDHFERHGRLEEKWQRGKEKREKQYRAYLAHQRRIDALEIDWHLLTFIFTRLRLANNVVEVEVRDAVIVDQLVRECPTIYHLTGRVPNTMGLSLDEDRPLAIVIKALVMSGLPVQRLTFHFDNYAISMEELNKDLNFRIHTRKVFQHLKFLDLQFSVYSLSSEQDLRSGINAIASAQNLETAVLRCHGHCELLLQALTSHKTLQVLASEVTFPKLKGLHLDRFWLRLAELVAFIKMHDLLEWIHLENCLIYAIGSVQSTKNQLPDGAADILKRLTGLENISMDKYCNENVSDEAIRRR